MEATGRISGGLYPTTGIEGCATSFTQRCWSRANTVALPRAQLIGVQEI